MTKKTKTFPVFINYDKAENISDTTRYEAILFRAFGTFDRDFQIGKKYAVGRCTEFSQGKRKRKSKVELFVRKNKDDKISKEFYYLGHMTASGMQKSLRWQIQKKTAVEIEWILDVPVTEDIYEYIVNA